MGEKPSHFLRHLAQLEFLHLAGGGLGQFREQHVARAFVASRCCTRVRRSTAVVVASEQSMGGNWWADVLASDGQRAGMLAFRFHVPRNWSSQRWRLNKHNRQELSGDQTGERRCAQEVFHRLPSARRSYYRILVTERPRREPLKFATLATSTQW
jgi:hypothetical protein